MIKSEKSNVFSNSCCLSAEGDTILNHSDPYPPTKGGAENRSNILHIAPIFGRQAKY